MFTLMVAKDSFVPEPVRVVGIEDSALFNDATKENFREDKCSVSFTLRPSPDTKWRNLFIGQSNGYGLGFAATPKSIKFGSVKESARVTIELVGIHVDDIPEHLEILKKRVHRTNTMRSQANPLDLSLREQGKRRGCLERRIQKSTGNLFRTQ